MKVLPCGDRAVLLDCDSLVEATSWFNALVDLEPVLGAATVLVRGNPESLRPLIGSRRPATGATRPGSEPIVIPVIYDGTDLTDVSELTGLSQPEIVAAHSGTIWTVGFGGFAPGFAYLVGGDPRLRVARHSTPRSSVPAGSVGLAGEFSGIYPRSSPGGWQLIGRTDVELFDLDQDPPALLQPGMRVRFEAIS